MVTYGPTLTNIDAMYVKAKEKKDGVYNFRGISYRVRNGNVTHYAANSQVIERCYDFHVIVGPCGIYQSQQVAALKSI